MTTPSNDASKSPRKLIILIAVLALFVIGISIALLVLKGEEEIYEEYVDDFFREGLANLTLVKTAGYDFSIIGTISVLPNSNSSYNFEELDVEGALVGAYDVTDAENPLFSLSFDLSLDSDGKGTETVKGELRFAEEILHFILSEITDFEGSVPLDVLEPFIGKWWNMSFSNEGLLNMFKIYKDEESMTPEEKELKELFSQTNIFKDVEFVGVEEVSGVSARKYSASLNSRAFVDYMVKSGEITEEPLSEEDLAEISMFVDNVDLEGHIWIGEDDVIFRKYSGKMMGEDFAEELEGLAVEFEIHYDLFDINEDVNIDPPEESDTFDLLKLLELAA